MMKRLKAIRNVMVDSLNRNNIPFPVDKSICSAWTEDLPYGGETVIFTSFMYQLSSLFKAYEKHLPAFADLGGSRKLASLGKFFIKPKKDELQRSYMILHNISGALQRAGISHGYLYDDEPYSGGLLLELGMLDEFMTYGRKVMDLFQEKGVKRIITVDPHTTNAMNRLKDALNVNLEVINYLSLLNEVRGNGRYVLHDPCLYTRYSNLGSRIRELLEPSGIHLVEDRMVTSREYGTCCGGPLGPVDLTLSDKIAEDRASKLKTVSSDVLVACPLCYQNLSPHIPGLKDIAEVIS